jgi:hypothetical protein
MNNNTINNSVEEVDKQRGRPSKRFTNWKLIAATPKGTKWLVSNFFPLDKKRFSIPLIAINSKERG